MPIPGCLFYYLLRLLQRLCASAGIRVLWVGLCWDKDAFSSCFGKVWAHVSKPTQRLCAICAHTGGDGDGAALGAQRRFSAVVTAMPGWPFAQPSASLGNLHVLAAGAGQIKGRDDECPFEPASPTPGGLSGASPPLPQTSGSGALQNLT